jgi:UDP-GlcNAc:undecaprenyl-phosphate GlcNAc-1-phosphate transferase
MELARLMSIFFTPLIMSGLAAFVFTPLVMGIYRRMGWLDDPKKKKHAKVVHTYPVPRGGGVVIFLALMTAAILFLGIDKHVMGILAGALVLTIVGVLDDIWDLNPYLRLMLGLVAAGLVVAAGIGIAFITNPFDGIIQLNKPQIAFYLLGKVRTVWVVADALAMVWILWVMNMVNWSKGVDGQLPGYVVIAAIVVAILSFRFSHDVTQWSVSVLAAITAGAYLGFLPWNFFPQKIMPGYGGGSLAGYLLAVLSILSGAKLATLIIVLGVPMMDAIYVMTTRILAGKSPVWGDRRHLHHKLMDLGWGKRRIAVFYWLVAGVLGGLVLQLNSTQKLFTIVLMAALFAGGILWLNYFISSSKQVDRDSG